MKLFFIIFRNNKKQLLFNWKTTGIFFYDKRNHYLLSKTSLNLNLGRALFKGNASLLNYYVTLLLNYIIDRQYFLFTATQYKRTLLGDELGRVAVVGEGWRRRRYKYLRIAAAAAPLPYTPRALPNVVRHARSWLNVRSLFHFKYPSYTIDGFSAN